ncbi:hypothetical protein OQA88_9264 [Cercophora sp. LCS_1]
MPSTLSLLVWAAVASASAFMPRAIVSPDEDVAAELYRRSGRGTRVLSNVQVPTLSSSTSCTTRTRTVVVSSSPVTVAAQATNGGAVRAKTRKGETAKETPSGSTSAVGVEPVAVEINVTLESSPATTGPQTTQSNRGVVNATGGKKIRTKSTKLASTVSSAVVQSSVAPEAVSSAASISTVATQSPVVASSRAAAKTRNRRPTRKGSKTRSASLASATGTTAVAPQDATASGSIPAASASSAASSAPAAVTGGSGILTANPTTPVPVSRAGGVLQPSAAAEANQRDTTATRAFSDVSIRAPNGQCLFIDPTAGDFRQNLIPVSLVDCTGSPNEKWDIITAGRHNAPSRKPATLVVSTLTQGCIAFDGRRQAGDTVTLFSCGGRADGSGETNSGQQFPYLGQLSFAFSPVSERNTTCILPGNGRLESLSFSAAQGRQVPQNPKGPVDIMPKFRDLQPTPALNTAGKATTSSPYSPLSIFQTMASISCANAPRTASLFIQLSMRRPTPHPILDLLLPLQAMRRAHSFAGTIASQPAIQTARPFPRRSAARNTIQGQARAFSTSGTKKATHAIHNPQIDEDGKEMMLEITQRAAKRLSEIMKKDDNPNLALRIQVESGGCHGFQYLMKLVSLPPNLSTEAPENDESATVQSDDTIFTYTPDGSPGVGTLAGPKIILDGPSLELLKGSKVDFTMELIGSQFKIVDNPLATSSCGCGTSFDIRI